MLQQYLESLARAGVTHIPAVTLPAATATAGQAPAARTAAPAQPARLQAVAPPATATLAPPASAAPSTPVQPAAPPREAAASVAGQVSPAAPATPAAASPRPAAVPSLAMPPRTKRQTELNILAEEVKNCTRCHELCTTRTQTVFGVGNPHARLCFLGEAPGADEDAQGIPFVGRAGKLLTDIIEKGITLKRSDVYILNVLKCRPPGNRTPTPEEAANCWPYLERQLEIIRPEFIVCLGATAAQRLLDTTAPIGKLRGRFYQFGNAQVLCTYHPAYLLRSPDKKKDTWEDMKLLMNAMGIEIPEKFR